MERDIKDNFQNREDGNEMMMMTTMKKKEIMNFVIMNKHECENEARGFMNTHLMLTSHHIQ